MNHEFLHTQRLLLRKITPQELNHFFESLDDTGLMRELGISSQEALQKEKEKHRLGYSDYRRTLLNFQLFDRASHTIIGNCGYHNWQREHSRAEIGYALTADEAKRKGLMSEALAVVLHYGFITMRLNRVEACVSPDNTASLRLLQKFNFTREGLLREHYFKNGTIEDSVILSLLQREYFSQPKSG